MDTDKEQVKKVDPRRIASCTAVMFSVLFSAALVPGAAAHASTVSEMYRTRALIPLSERDYPQAMELLDKAVAADADDAQAWYFRGLINSRRGHYADAVNDLEAASALGFDHPELFYELGFAYFRLQRYPAARKSLQRSLAGKPAPEYAARARALLARIALQERRDREFQLEVSAGFMHDSNVGLHADDAPLPAGQARRDDSRWQLALDGKWKPALFAGAPLTLGYRFFQSLHQKLDQFDLRHHALIADWRQRHDSYIWGVNYQYSQASLDNNDYVQSHQLLPSLMLYHGRQRASLLKLIWRNDRYDPAGLNAYDGNRYQADYRHYWLPSDSRYYYLGAVLRQEDTDDASLAFSGSGVTAGVLTHWQNLRISADVQVQRKHYPDSPLRRDDDYYRAELILNYPLTPHLQMDVSAAQVRNKSDATSFDYSRTLYGVTLRWQL